MARWLAELLAMLSSSFIDVPDIVSFKTALVNVLFVRVWEPVRVVTVESMA